MSAAACWYVYVLECRDGSLYTGITVDTQRRFAQHVAGTGARYTRSHPPVRLLGWHSFPDRAHASRAECQVKRLTPAAKRAWCTRAREDLSVPAQNNAQSTCSKPHSETTQTRLRRYGTPAA